MKEKHQKMLFFFIICFLLLSNFATRHRQSKAYASSFCCSQNFVYTPASPLYSQSIFASNLKPKKVFGFKRKNCETHIAFALSKSEVL